MTESRHFFWKLNPVRWCVWTSLTLCWTSSWWMPLKTWKTLHRLWWQCWGTGGSPTALKRRLINCTLAHHTALFYVFYLSNEKMMCFYLCQALATACWSVLKAKRRLLMVSWSGIVSWKGNQPSTYFDTSIIVSTQVPDGFISHFYAISEHVSPVLAFGFLGPRQHLTEVCTIFKVRRHAIPAVLNRLWVWCVLIITKFAAVATVEYISSSFLWHSDRQSNTITEEFMKLHPGDL